MTTSRVLALVGLVALYAALLCFGVSFLVRPTHAHSETAVYTLVYLGFSSLILSFVSHSRRRR